MLASALAPAPESAKESLASDAPASAFTFATPRMVSAKLNLRNPIHRNAMNANREMAAMRAAAWAFALARSFEVCPATAPTSVPRAIMQRTSVNVGSRANTLRRPTDSTTSKVSILKLSTPMR